MMMMMNRVCEYPNFSPSYIHITYRDYTSYIISPVDLTGFLIFKTGIFFPPLT